MESPSSPKGLMPDFTFGLNEPSYSDRTLRLEIVDEIETDDDNFSDLERNTKRRRCVDLTKEPRVKIIHISTSILASRSSYFRKLFSNGMLESLQKDVTLRIDASEEASLMDLLKYLYSNNLPTSLNALLDLCLIADKFEVVSCLRDCVRSLQTLPMTCESASLYLDLPQSLLMCPATRKLIDAAKKCLFAKFKDFHKFKEEMLSLPLAGIKEVLASDDLEVTSECVVYDFVLQWARKHYTNLEERRGILKTHLLDLVRFPFMTTTKLAEEVKICSDIDPEVASKIVFDAIRFKAETPHQKHCLAAAKDKENTASHQFVERAYIDQPVNLVGLQVSNQPLMVLLHFTQDKLKQMTTPGGQIMSETFHLGGQELVLFGEIKETGILGLGLKVLGSATVTVDYDILLRKRTTHSQQGYGQLQQYGQQEYGQLIQQRDHDLSGMRYIGMMRRQFQPVMNQLGMVGTHNQPQYQFKSFVSGIDKFTERIKYLGSINWNNNNTYFSEDNVLYVMAVLTMKK